MLAVFVADWDTLPIAVAVATVLVQTWLCVGLFIVSHDCMHGSLAPGRPAVNRWVGRIALFLYACFSYDRLLPAHHRHHRRPGSEADPDFHPAGRGGFWPWFAHFLKYYFGWREFLLLGAVVTLYAVLLGTGVWRALAFFALPAMLSAVQLFYFGTYRPHRRDEAGFADRHNSRSDGFPWLVSLLTCFHFGYHHEHHLSPTTPWWRLPALRAASSAPALGTPAATTGKGRNP